MNGPSMIYTRRVNSATYIEIIKDALSMCIENVFNGVGRDVTIPIPFGIGGIDIGISITLKKYYLEKLHKV